MQFKDHSNLKGKHAFLSASKCTWLGWTNEEFIERFFNQYSTTIGELLHKLAEKMIRKRIPLGKRDKTVIALFLMDNGIPRYLVKPEKWVSNLSNYIEDGIKFGMETEVLLYYSDFCFGTADSISFDNNILRIHDLKTGTTKVHMEQLLIYAALFCLQESIDPHDISFELRIYQGNDVIYHNPEPDEVKKFMEIIIDRNDYITNFILKKYK